MREYNEMFVRAVFECTARQAVESLPDFLLKEEVIANGNEKPLAVSAWEAEAAAEADPFGYNNISVVGKSLGYDSRSGNTKFSIFPREDIFPWEIVNSTPVRVEFETVSGFIPDVEKEFIKEIDISLMLTEESAEDCAFLNTRSLSCFLSLGGDLERAWGILTDFPELTSRLHLEGEMSEYYILYGGTVLRRVWNRYWDYDVVSISDIETVSWKGVTPREIREYRIIHTDAWIDVWDYNFPRNPHRFARWMGVAVDDHFIDCYKRLVEAVAEPTCVKRDEKALASLASL